MCTDMNVLQRCCLLVCVSACIGVTPCVELLLLWASSYAGGNGLVESLVLPSVLAGLPW